MYSSFVLSVCFPTSFSPFIHAVDAKGMEDFVRGRSKYITDNIANAMDGFPMTSEHSLKTIPKNVTHLLLTQYCDQKYSIPVLDFRSWHFSQLVRLTFCGQCLQKCHTLVIAGTVKGNDKEE